MSPEEGLMNWDNSELSRDGEGRETNETEKQISLEVRRWEASNGKNLWSEIMVAFIQIVWKEKQKKQVW